MTRFLFDTAGASRQTLRPPCLAGDGYNLSHVIKFFKTEETEMRKIIQCHFVGFYRREGM